MWAGAGAADGTASRWVDALESSGNRMWPSTAFGNRHFAIGIHQSSRPRRDMNDTPRYPAASLVAFAQDLLVRMKVRDDIAHDVATVLVEGDLLGHTTHGLALLPGYLTELDNGTMARAGEPTIVNARPAAQAWDCGRLPGPWLTLRALDAAMTMATTYGTGSVVIRRSHHIGCLAAYLKRATDRHLMALIYCSDPAMKSVAPFGGVTPVFTPNPFAAGIPTGGDPILLDISASYTTNGMTGRLHKAGEKLPHPWIQDAKGNATTDPAVLFNEPKGTLLPLGGLEGGHKGYGLALLVEALTGGLGGFGRADPAEGWGATVFVQVLDPAAFGGVEAYARQMDWLVDACHDATPREGVARVRLPGENGMKRHREQTAQGVALFPAIMPSLQPWAEKLGCDVPAAE
jgi:LDH2 family malate/lactate/ureidoglycolate dehydrogenase